MDNFMMETSIPITECKEHAPEITRCIIIFYLQCRMYFACNEANSIREKNKMHNNLSKH